MRGLNGIRAIAAVGVLLSHINLSLTKYKVESFSLFETNRGWTLGEQGVTMFFVLSGFLITYLLILEKNKTGSIDKNNFYRRRILRIFPLYYLYLSIALLTVYLTTSELRAGGGIISLYILLLANIPFIIEKAIPACDHLWSIAVEEQFYLFWPFVFKQNINFRKILFASIIISVLIRVLLWKFFPFKIFTIFFTVNRFDCMMFGGLIAVLYIDKSQFMNIINHKASKLFAYLVILIHIVNYEIVNSIVSMELVTLATGIIICDQISNTKPIVNFENRIMNFLGKYSYGIYIYHPLYIYLLAKLHLFDLIKDDNLRGISIFITITTITIFTAYCSYEFFENRFIMLKNRFSEIHTTNN